MSYSILMTTSGDRENVLEAILRLWLCRLFTGRAGFKRFFGKSGFNDDDVAYALGMDDWVDTTEDVSAQDVWTHLKQLSREMEAIEARDQLIGKACAPMAPLMDAFQLNDTERCLLLYLSMRQSFGALGDAFGLFRFQSLQSNLLLHARMLGVSPKCLSDALSARGTLVRSSLIKSGQRSLRCEIAEFSNQRFGESLLEEPFSMETVMRSIVVPARPPSLEYKDYPHLKQSLGYLRAHLRLALRERRQGVNIFIHGPPGTGKSELSRLLARELRAGLYEVSSEDAEGNAEVGNSRMNSLRMALTILSRQRTLLVFDEAEDIFGGGSIFHRSLAAERKGWMNRLLESNPVPVIWISNSGQGLDPAYVRRFDFVFEVGVPPKKQRRRMIQKICQQTVSPALVQQLAECPQLSAAVVARADSVANGIQAALPNSGKDEVLQHLIKQTLVAQGHGEQVLEPTIQPIPAVFDLKYLNSAFSLPEFAARITAGSSCRMCLYGPAGTGKSTLGYWLADKLEQPLHLKRASDILSPYVGQAEQNIARIFKHAREDKAILMIDEVDSFLQDRRQAQRGWEVSGVNEMLTQMERFEGIFIASTNLVDGLDQAALRRFDLKIHIDYMRPDQVCELLQAYALRLKLKMPSPAILRRAESLSTATPGDFANVARQHQFRVFADVSAFLEAVVEECAMKDCGSGRAMGF